MAIPNWANRTLWTGDNLDIMRGMNSESVDLIYLDPPFNSNRNYAAPIGSEAAGAAFKDTWTLDDVDQAWHGEIAERDPTLYAIIDAAGYAHGKGMKSYLIMMAVRLMEMRRILKDTGSIYLHCDPTASHYLKTLMDGVFGAGNFRSEIVWKRSHSHNSAKRYGRIHDVVFFYTRSDLYEWFGVRQPYSRDYVDRFFKFDDDDGRGRYWTGDITGSGLRNGDTGKPWRGFDPSAKGRHWMVPPDRLELLDADGRIFWPPTEGAWPKLKRYLTEAKGLPLQDVVDDIHGLSTMGARRGERLGYPTQKPLALLERVIEASSDKGQVVLDPFCGCATACVAAEKLGRQWVGIDLSAKAADLVKLRLRKEMGLFYDVHHRLDVPQRLDQEKVPDYRTHKHTLYGVQEGLCAGCRVMFPFRNMTVDHVVPQYRGGTDHMTNLQLLCAACNSMKGTRSQEEFVAVLLREGLRQQGTRTG